MRWSSEKLGMAALQPIANSKFHTSYDKKRIWSESFESWGFFCDDVGTLDEFLLWCLIKPGDRIFWETHPKSKEIFTIVKIWKDEKVQEYPLWTFRFLGSDLKILDVKVKEKELFIEAMKLI